MLMSSLLLLHGYYGNNILMPSEGLVNNILELSSFSPVTVSVLLAQPFVQGMLLAIFRPLSVQRGSGEQNTSQWIPRVVRSMHEIVRVMGWLVGIKLMGEGFDTFGKGGQQRFVVCSAFNSYQRVLDAIRFFK